MVADGGGGRLAAEMAAAENKFRQLDEASTLTLCAAVPYSRLVRPPHACCAGGPAADLRRPAPHPREQAAAKGASAGRLGVGAILRRRDPEARRAGAARVEAAAPPQPGAHGAARGAVPACAAGRERGCQRRRRG